MKGLFILFFVGFLSYSKPASAQFKDSSYYKGNFALITKTIRKINRKFAPDVDSAYSMLAVIEINTKGILESLQVTSFKYSSMADVVYNILLETKNDWVNNTGSNLYFELPIYTVRVYDNKKEDPHTTITTLDYNEDKMTNHITLEPIICQIFPMVR
jgi:hypothetical protein